jgi:hypothetical protein
MAGSRVALAENVSWERMVRAVEKVKERLGKATAALQQAGIEYAVIGGNAVAAWVSSVDEGAVRNTRDVDILLRRNDLPAAIQAMAQAGFTHHELMGVDMFLDGPSAKPSEAVHLLFAGEVVRENDLAPTPDLSESEMSGAGYRVLRLEALVRMKLTSYRDKDRTHVRDMIGVGLIDATWPARFPPELAARLQAILNDPNG